MRESYLALHLALLFEAAILWSVSHTGEVCLGVVSEEKKHTQNKEDCQHSKHTHTPMPASTQAPTVTLKSRLREKEA